MNTPSCCVVGMGNILFRDEGVGVYAAHHLRRTQAFTPQIEVADGAALGFGVMDFFAGFDRLLVLDALLADDRPGAIYRLSNEQLLDLGPGLRPTAHEVDPIHLLKLASALGRAPQMVLLGIVPADASGPDVGLTPQLAAAFPRYVAAALDELSACGIHARQVARLTLDEVIEGLVTRA